MILNLQELQSLFMTPEAPQMIENACSSHDLAPSQKIVICFLLWSIRGEKATSRRLSTLQEFQFTLQVRLYIKEEMIE
ncbi:hypothetical protein L5515_016457 [Caenorhabditis briggsae]|uniref:Uncharacterized protein n=1 Tax=Caenorhabditis briggsae TaxID=6238 RepID=A0AAE9JNN1_CAEBR|nr:hypothetical protein L5515_016457 [Caenorhabditis briggsae]